MTFSRPLTPAHTFARLRAPSHAFSRVHTSCDETDQASADGGCSPSPGEAVVDMAELLGWLNKPSMREKGKRFVVKSTKQRKVSPSHLPASVGHAWHALLTSLGHTWYALLTSLGRAWHALLTPSAPSVPRGRSAT